MLDSPGTRLMISVSDIKIKIEFKLKLIPYHVLSVGTIAGCGGFSNTNFNFNFNFKIKGVSPPASLADASDFFRLQKK